MRCCSPLNECTCFLMHLFAPSAARSTTHPTPAPYPARYTPPPPVTPPPVGRLSADASLNAALLFSLFLSNPAIPVCPPPSVLPGSFLFVSSSVTYSGCIPSFSPSSPSSLAFPPYRSVRGSWTRMISARCSFPPATAWYCFICLISLSVNLCHMQMC